MSNTITVNCDMPSCGKEIIEELSYQGPYIRDYGTKINIQVRGKRNLAWDICPSCQKSLIKSLAKEFEK